MDVEYVKLNLLNVWLLNTIWVRNS